MATLFSELKRRNVFRVGVAYIVASWLVIEVASVLLDIYTAPGWVLRVLVGLLVLGLPLALGFSWAFELTPEGLRREAGIAPDRAITHQTARRLDVITIVLLLGAVGFVTYDRFLSDRTHAPVQEPASAETANVVETNTTPAIAVLPFADMSAEQDQEYFSDGIAEELLNLLAKVPGLKVAARTSSFRFREAEHDITQIAHTLGVNHVLEGSVRKAGNRVRVTAQLIDARDGFHVWSESYDQDLVDILAVQDRISRQIVEALSTHLGVALKATTLDAPQLVDPATYEAYLRGKHARHQRTPESMLLAVSSYEEAVARSPGFAPAWGGLARSALLASEMYPLRFNEFIAQHAEAIERALALDPDEPQALATHATQAFDERLEFATGLEQLKRVIEIEPADTEAMSWLAQRYRLVGMLDRAEALNRRAYALDPLSPRVILGMTRILTFAGQYEEARRVAEKAVVNLDGHQYAIRAMLDYRLYSGQLAGTQEWLDRLNPDPANIRYRYQLSFAAGRGERETVLSLMREAREAYRDAPLEAALFGFEGHWLVGDHDRAHIYLAEARRLGFRELGFYQVPPSVWQLMPEAARLGTINLAPVIADYPELVAGYASLGIDIVAEVEAHDFAELDPAPQ